MGTHPEISDALREWIDRQSVFFVATAPEEGGHVNVSPKGLDTFRVLSPKKVAYLDLTGSGAETTAHLQQNGRITLMWCSFAKDMRILRLYGTGTVKPIEEATAEGLMDPFPEFPGVRSVIEVEVSRVSTSCGYGLPVFSGEPAERPTLVDWAERKGPDGLAEYREKNNSTSIDGLPGITW